MQLFFPFRNNKRRRNVSAFAELIATPAMSGTLPAGARLRLTCVTPGLGSAIGGTTYADMTAGQQFICTNAETGEAFSIAEGSRLDIDVGLGVWKKIAGDS